MLRNVAGVAAVTVAVLIGASMSFARAVPTVVANQRPGTCHLAEDPNELIAIPSDSAPAVACTQPHQTETMWVTTVAGPLAASKIRPNGELLNQKLSGSCYDYQRERAYLGAGTNDVTWGILSWARFPTAAAWAKGDRTLVCQGSSVTDSPTGPTIDYPIVGIMTTRRSAKFRLCRAPTGAVTCDLPHSMEDTSPNVNLTGAWPGLSSLTARAVTECSPIVDAYLGQPIGARPGLVVRPDVPTQEVWTAGNTSINCWIATADGHLETGTVRGGLI